MNLIDTNILKALKVNFFLKFLIFLIPIWVIPFNSQLIYIGLITSIIIAIYLFFFGDINFNKLINNYSFQSVFVLLLVISALFILAESLSNFKATAIYLIRLYLPSTLIFLFLFSKNIKDNAQTYLSIFICSLFVLSTIEFINSVYFTINKVNFNFTEVYYNIKRVSLFSSDSNWWAIILFPIFLILIENLKKNFDTINSFLVFSFLFFIIMTFSKATIFIIFLYIFVEIISYVIKTSDKNIFKILVAISFFSFVLFYSYLYPNNSTRFLIVRECMNFYSDATLSGIVLGLGVDGFPKKYWHNAHVLCGAFIEYGLFFVIIFIIFIMNIINTNTIKFIFWLIILFNFSLFPVAQFFVVLLPLILYNHILNNEQSS